ncbi:uncharacterized protein LOC107305477 [Oryza brachyantha]|nr:uncharacterized protein LOC107305477 [Oryza brachyantha]
MAAAASTTSSSCITFIAESMILPTRNIRLFAPIFLLIFGHTFVFLAVAAIHVNPLAASIDVHTLAAGIPLLVHAPGSTTTHAAPTDTGAIRGHAKKGALVYLAYLLTRLAVQVVAVVAGCTTYSGERLAFTELLGWNAIKGRITRPLTTAMFLGILDLATVALVAVGVSGMASILSFPLLLAAVVFYVHLSAVTPVSIAVSSAEGRWAAPALWQAWRLMKARRKEAGVLTLIACLVPAAVWPVYAIAATLSDRLWISTFFVWLMGIVFGFFLLPVALQLLATAAATVFYYHCVEVHAAVARGPENVPVDVDHNDAVDHV